MGERDLGLAKVQPTSRVRTTTRRESRLLVQEIKTPPANNPAWEATDWLVKDTNCFSYWKWSAVTYTDKREKKREGCRDGPAKENRMAFPRSHISAPVHSGPTFILITIISSTASIYGALTTCWVHAKHFTCIILIKSLRRWALFQSLQMKTLWLSEVGIFFSYTASKWQSWDNWLQLPCS